MGAAAAVAMPVFMDLVTPPVDQPGQYSTPQINQRKDYQDKILEGGFDSNNELYRLAAERQSAGMNRQLAQRGMANSGMALGAQSQASADLYNRYMQDAQARRIGAYNTVMAPEYQQQNLNSQGESRREGRRWEQYGIDRKARADKIEGMGKMAGSLGGMMGSGGGGGTPNPASTSGGFSNTTSYSGSNYLGGGGMTF